MRYLAAYFLMLFYMVIMLKPLIPVICDAWSHIFAEAEHIATIHAKYGSNHLETAQICLKPTKSLKIRRKSDGNS